MLTLEQRATPHTAVVDAELQDGEAVLLHLDSRSYYSLNLTGMRIWQAIKAGLPLADVSRRLQAEFDVTETDADTSVLALVNELLNHKLVEMVA
jgi:hypothetical protein